MNGSSPRRRVYRGLEVLVYPTSRALVEEYFTEDGHMEWDRSHTFYDGDKPFTVTAAEALKNIRRKGYWAYVSNKSQFHIWFRRNVSDENLIRPPRPRIRPPYAAVSPSLQWTTGGSQGETLRDDSSHGSQPG